MRRSASEIIRELEGRIARLEGRTANKHSDLKISTSWYTGSPSDDKRDLTFAEIIAEVNREFASAQNRLQDYIAEGYFDKGTQLDLYVDIGGGRLNISWGLDNGSTKLQGGCLCSLYQAFVSAGCGMEDYVVCAKKLQRLLKRGLKSVIFSPITKA